MKPLAIIELSIVVAAKTNNPTVLNPDFLKRNGIVPESWDLAEPPVCMDPVAIVKFANGVSIQAQSDRILFSESLKSPDLSKVEVAFVVEKYLEKLAHVNYTAVGINPTGAYAVEEGAPCTPLQFLRNRLMCKEDWLTGGDALEQIGIKLSFRLPTGIMNINVDPGVLMPPGKPPTPAIILMGNHHLDLVTRPAERLEETLRRVAEWKKTLDEFHRIAERIILSK